MGAPAGNTNSADGKRYRKAVERALAHEAGSVDDGLFAIAQKRVQAAMTGDAEAAERIADRFDGKPHQSIGTDPGQGPLQVIINHTEDRL